MINKKLFGKTEAGKDIYVYNLTNNKGESVSILDYGGTIQSIKIKNKNDTLIDVALGFSTAVEYQKNDGYLGALIGRYANRINKGRFTLNGKEYKLYTNNGSNHLHGGKEGYDKKIWNAEIKGEELILTLKSPDMEEGYPGNLDIKVVYSFSDDSELNINYYAVSDKDTIVNLTNHCYFNLSGENSGDILSHKIKIYANSYTKTDKESIPTGKQIKIKGTAFDFKDFKEIGRDISVKDSQLVFAGGYDHNYVLNGKGKYGLAAELLSEQSGILMQVYTDKEGIQFYSGNYLKGLKGKSGTIYNKNFGLCLETQHFPDSINHMNFPSPILKAGEKYNYKTSYKFIIK